MKLLVLRREEKRAGLHTNDTDRHRNNPEKNKGGEKQKDPTPSNFQDPQSQKLWSITGTVCARKHLQKLN
jgi:hypothetical protein